MVRVEFIEKVRFVTSEKFEVLSSTSIAIRNWKEIELFIDNVICPTASARENIIDRICMLKINQGFSLAGCKKCKYIRLISK